MSQEESTETSPEAAAFEGAYAVLNSVPYGICEIDCTPILEDLKILWPPGTDLDQAFETHRDELINLRTRIKSLRANQAHFALIERTASWYQEKFFGSDEQISRLKLLFRMLLGENVILSWTFSPESACGETLFFQADLTVSEVTNGQVTKILFTSVDVTESRNEFENQISEQNRYQQLLNASPSVIVEMDVQKMYAAFGKLIDASPLTYAKLKNIDKMAVLNAAMECEIIFYNAEAETVFGNVTAATLLGAVEDAGSEQQAERMVGYVGAMMHGDRFGPFEIQVRSKDGSPRYYSMNLVVRSRFNGFPNYLIYAGTDVTDAKVAEQLRQKESGDFTSRLDATPLPILEVDVTPVADFVYEQMQSYNGNDFHTHLRTKEEEMIQALEACCTIYANAAAKEADTDISPLSFLPPPSIATLSERAQRAFELLGLVMTSKKTETKSFDVYFPGRPAEAHVLHFAVSESKNGIPSRVICAVTNVESKMKARRTVERLLSDYETLFTAAPILAREEDLSKLVQLFAKLERESGCTIEDLIKSDKSIFYSNLSLVKTVRLSDLAKEFYPDTTLDGVLRKSHDSGEVSCALRFIQSLRATKLQQEVEAYVFKVLSNRNHWRWLMVTMRGLEFEGEWPTRLLTMELDITRRTILQDIHRAINEIGVGFRGNHYMAELLRVATRVLSASEARFAVCHEETGLSMTWHIDRSGRLSEIPDPEVNDRLAGFSKEDVRANFSNDQAPSDSEPTEEATPLLVDYPIRDSKGQIIGDIRLNFEDSSLTSVDIAATMRIIAEAAEAEITRSLVESRMRRHNELLESSVRKRTRQLDELNRELEAFSYTVSHDLRAPARHIGIYAHEIISDSESTLSASSSADLDRIADLASNMGQMTKGLLSFSRLGRASVNRELIELPKLIAQICPSIIAEFGSNAKISGEVHKEEFADQNLSSIVWSNLLSNAIKYSSKEENPAIQIGSETRGCVLWHWIEDNGTGFPASQNERIFEPFQRLPGASDFPGTGVGLATVRRIIENHGGEIIAKSIEPKEARFEFTFGTKLENLGGGDRIRTGE